MGRLRLRFQATQQSLSDPSPWGDSLRLFEPKINGAFGVGGGGSGNLAELLGNFGAPPGFASCCQTSVVLQRMGGRVLSKTPQNNRAVE